jgi:WD40 repeat protein
MFDVISVAFDSTGGILASGGSDELVNLCDSSSGRLIRTLKGHRAAISSVAFDPGGRHIASGGLDGTIKLWKAASGRLLHTLEGHKGFILGVAFDHAGRQVGSGSDDKTIKLWEAASGRLLHTLEGHQSSVTCVAFDPTGQQVASGSDDTTVKLWDATSGRLIRTLEGHLERVLCIAFSPDGRCLVSKGSDGSIGVWRADSGDCVTVVPDLASTSWPPGLAFHPRLPLLAAVGTDPDAPGDECDRVVYIYELNLDLLLGNAKTPSISYTSAKVVLVGESNVGKSYLAHRIATGLPPLDGSIKSTHGMKFWPLAPERLGSSVAPTGERRDIVLWDMGGQEEYRLIHQLFLHDTTVAIMLFDPTRGTGEFRDVETWNKYLEKQMRGRTAVKLLVGAKLDEPNTTIDHHGVERLVKECGFAGYFETSAISGRGLPEFCDAVAKAIDWNSLGKTSRPELFQRIRDEIELRRNRGEVVLHVTELEHAVVEQDPELREAVDRVVRSLESKGEVTVVGAALVILDEFPLPDAISADTARTLDYIQRTYEELRLRWLNQKLHIDLIALHQAVIAKDVAAVVEQLATQGLIARSNVFTGESVLVLQVQEIERYAGSLILAARNNPRDVPALELRAIAQEGIPLPGIAEDERLPREQERVVLECTVQLMLEHGICFQHEGLLVFPSLFAPVSEVPDGKVPHAVSLYYDFAGAIDNVYASLVAWLVLAKEFGKVRLRANRAEFEVKDGGLCGLYKVGRPGGFAHVDVYFEAETPERKCKEFISFVEDHLARNGVEIREHVAIKCGCGHDLAEETLRQRIARGDKDVVCPICETRHSLIEGAAAARRRDPGIQQHTWALRTEIQRQREQVSKHAVEVLAKAEAAMPATGPIRLLHLSDLHFTKETTVATRLQWLLDDLKQDGGLGFKELDYLVISGDFTDKGCTEGFEKAYEFVSGLRQEFVLSAERCIFVPGNHDVRDLNEVYEWRNKPDGLKEGEWVKQGEIILARNAEKYPLRLKAFSDSFYHKFVQRPYPPDYAAQGMSIPFWETGIQFLALNTCWQIDQFYRKRSGVHAEAVANAIKLAQKQEDDARKEGQLAADKSVLRIGVWHHAFFGPDQIQDTQFLGHLQKFGVRVALHGDVHEMRRDLVGYRHNQQIQIVGSGSFGAPAEHRPESTPRLYNVLEIARDLKAVRVHTRCQSEANGPWKGWHEWPDLGGGNGQLAYYDIQL